MLHRKPLQQKIGNAIVNRRTALRGRPSSGPQGTFFVEETMKHHRDFADTPRVVGDHDGYLGVPSVTGPLKWLAILGGVCLVAAIFSSSQVHGISWPLG